MATALGFDELRNPVVLIRINGEPAEELERRRLDFTFTQKFRKRDECRMTFRDTDRALSNGALLQPGDVWEIRWGYYGDMSRVRVLTLKSWKPNYDANAPKVSITFRVTRGRTSKKGSSKKARYGSEPEHTFSPRNWGVIQSSEVAKKIARRHRLKFKGNKSEDANKNAPFLQPGNMSDFEYLQQLAADIDFECFVEDGTLFYREKPYTEAPRRVLWYHPTEGETYLLSFQPDVKIAKVSIKPRSGSSGDLRSDKQRWREYKRAVGKLGKNASFRQVADLAGKFGLNRDQMNEAAKNVSLAASLPGALPTGDSQPGGETYSAFVGRLAGDFLRAEAPTPAAWVVAQNAETTQAAGPGAEQGRVLGVTGFQGNASDIQAQFQAGSTQVVAADEELVKKKAAAVFTKKSDKAVTASASVIGSPRFRSRTNLRVEGVGRRFSAKWYVRDSTHSIRESNAYTVALKLKRGSLNDTQGPKKKAKKEKEAPQEQTEAKPVLAIQGFGGNASKITSFFTTKDEENTAVPQS